MYELGIDPCLLAERNGKRIVSGQGFLRHEISRAGYALGRSAGKPTSPTAGMRYIHWPWPSSPKERRCISTAPQRDASGREVGSFQNKQDVQQRSKLESRRAASQGERRSIDGDTTICGKNRQNDPPRSTGS